MKTADEYIKTLVRMQFRSDAKLDCLDVFYTEEENNNLFFTPKNGNPGLGDLVVKVGRITIVKDFDSFEGSEIQRKSREEIQEILNVLYNMKVMLA